MGRRAGAATAADRVAQRARRRRRVARWLIAGVVLVAVTAVLVVEARTSRLQARLFASFDTGLGFEVEPKPNPAMSFPDNSPYDTRLEVRGACPSSSAGSTRAAFGSTARRAPHRGSRRSWPAASFPSTARRHRPASASWTARGASSLGPLSRSDLRELRGKSPAVVSALLFIEDRQLLDESRPYLNPAINWGTARARRRRGRPRAVRQRRPGDRGEARWPRRSRSFGTRPKGARPRRGKSFARCCRQACARIEAARETLAARRLIVVDYLNSVPLAAAPDHGEVHGLDDGLHCAPGSAPTSPR